MRSKLLPLLAALALLGFANSAFAQTATATATATNTATATATATNTATATPTPVAVTVNPNQDVTHFGYWAANREINSSTTANTYGGMVVYQKATAALVLGQAVQPDASNANSVVVATQQNAPHVMGVVVGSRVSAFSSDQIGFPPKTGQIAIVQISGIVKMMADGAITKGHTVIVSAAIVGGAADGAAAGTVSANAIGMALTSTTGAAQPINVVLETARGL